MERPQVKTAQRKKKQKRYDYFFTGGATILSKNLRNHHKQGFYNNFEVKFDLSLDNGRLT